MDYTLKFIQHRLDSGSVNWEADCTTMLTRKGWYLMADSILLQKLDDNVLYPGQIKSSALSSSWFETPSLFINLECFLYLCAWFYTDFTISESLTVPLNVNRFAMTFHANNTSYIMHLDHKTMRCPRTRIGFTQDYRLQSVMHKLEAWI